MEYRRDIDGLRAIAILPVIFFHAGFSKFHYGYLGVDIFFVISGYVITQSIFARLNKTGKVDIKFFFIKRIRRILPNLIFISSVTYILYLFFGPPNITLWLDYLSTIFGISNLFFLFSFHRPAVWC